MGEITINCSRKLLICFCAFIYTFNNRVSALIRGYLAGIEDVINEDINENIFI